MIRNPYAALERATGHRFRRRKLLELALVHPSYRHETAGIDDDNQRLEFLGDAVLALLAAHWLYRHHPDLGEGDLTRLRSGLTRAETLAGLGGELGLGAWLKLGRGEILSGGAERDSNLADAVEALLGAVWLDGGLKAAEKVFRKLFVPRLDVLPPHMPEGNTKGALQEYCQRHFRESPGYRVIGEDGPAHKRHFTVEVRLGDRVLGEGTGSSKRIAERRAAGTVLEQLRREPEEGERGGKTVIG